MKGIVGSALALGLLLGASVEARAQAANYPPAAGHMVIIPPIFPSPNAIGSAYVETFPSFEPVDIPGPNYEEPVVEPGPLNDEAAKGARAQRPAPQKKAAKTQAGLRRRRLQPNRTYSRGYNLAPAPYATELPVGQLYWPGAYLAPSFTPDSRYQTFGSGYRRSPYGSNFYGGYWKGWPSY
jgi:hypothetical protein